MADSAMQIINDEIQTIIKFENQLATMEAELQKVELFQKYLKLSKELPAQLEQFWDQVKQHMEESNIKSVRGEWGSITLAERVSFDINEKELLPEYFKKVPNTKKIGDDFRLEGEPPIGATPKYTRYLVKRIK